MRRPLVVLAAGFVLGEVLALQAYVAVDMRILSRLCAAAAGVLWLWRAGSGMYSGLRRKDMQGRSCLQYKVLLLFLSCLLAGFSLGGARGWKEREILDREEAMAGGLSGARVLVRGRVHKVQEKEGAVTVTLEDAVTEAGRKSAGFRRVMVYVENEGADGNTCEPQTTAAGGVGDLAVGGDSERTVGGDSDLAVGMEIAVRGSLEPVEGPRNPGEFDFRTYYRTKGTACRMFGEGLEIVGGEPVPYDSAVGEFRSWCTGVLERICLPEDAAVFKAVLLGDSSAMAAGVRDMYQRHGISHLLAVSGQHLAIIGGGIYLILRRAGLGYGKAGAVSAFLVVSYGVLTGSSGSAIRAVIMILCLWLSAVRGRSYDTMSALGLAALILLFQEPYLLFHSGFQLSFGAVLAIGGLGSWIRPALGLERAWEKTLLISLCVQIIITPIVLYHYYQYPLYGIVLNLLVIPLVTILMYSGILGIALGSFWVSGGMVAVGAGHYILRFYEWLCSQIEHLPGYCLVVGRPAWLQMGLYGLGMWAALTGIRVWAGRSRGAEEGCGPSEAGGNPQWFCRFRPLLSLAVLTGTYALCFLVLLPSPVKGMEAVCLDVGQGDGILLLTKDHVVLVDGGSSSQKDLGSRTLEPYLKSRGITCIDYAVVSHGDGDHISGLTYLLEESRDIRIKNLVMPVMGQGQDVYEGLASLAVGRSTGVAYMGKSDRIDAGTLTLTCLYAGEDFPGEDRNGHSLVICVDYGEFHMLLTGDMGEPQENRLLELAAESRGIQNIHLNHVQVLKAAHHGSRTSSSQEFLDRLNVRLALVSYGRGNRYGHPSPEVLERLDRRGAAVMETGTSGAVTVKTDGEYLWVHSFLLENPH